MKLVTRVAQALISEVAKHGAPSTHPAGDLARAYGIGADTGAHVGGVGKKQLDALRAELRAAGASFTVVEYSSHKGGFSVTALHDVDAMALAHESAGLVQRARELAVSAGNRGALTKIDLRHVDDLLGQAQLILEAVATSSKQ